MPTVILKIKRIEIPPSGIHMLLKIYLNNKAARFVLDTGASQTVLDQERLAHFIPKGNKRKLEATTSGIGSTTLESHAVTIKNIRIDDLEIKNHELILLDLKHVNDSYKMMGLKQVDGILGSDILNSYKAVIDFGKLRISFKWKPSKQ